MFNVELHLQGNCGSVETDMLIIMLLNYFTDKLIPNTKTNTVMIDVP